MAAARDQFRAWKEGSLNNVSQLDGNSFGELTLGVAASVGAGVAGVGEGLMAGANYSANWVSMLTGGFGNEDNAMAHARELEQSHNAAIDGVTAFADRDNRAAIGLAAYDTFKGVQNSDMRAIGNWTSFFSEVGTGAALGGPKTLPAVGSVAKKSAVVMIEAGAKAGVVAKKILPRLNPMNYTPEFGTLGMNGGRWKYTGSISNKEPKSPPEQVHGGRFDVGPAYPTGSGVKPDEHNANVRLLDSNGNTLNRWREVSGEATIAQKDLGQGLMRQSTHTEQKGLTRVLLEDGQTLRFTGQKAPCSNCQGAMRKSTLNNKGRVEYQWIDDKKNIIQREAWEGGKVVKRF